MPGLYVNAPDAGSAIADALSGFASAYSPETRARAALLAAQTEQANLQARLLSSQVPAAEMAAGSVPGILGPLHADPTLTPGGSADVGPPTLGGAPGGPVAGPNDQPYVRGVLTPRLAGMSPYARYIANEVIAGRMSPDALNRAINLGQAGTLGPANTFEAQKEVGVAEQMPRAVSANERVYFDPVREAGLVPKGTTPIAPAGPRPAAPTPAPAKGPGYLEGPDITGTTAATETAKSTSATADKALEVGGNAWGARAQLQRLAAIYDRLAKVDPSDAQGWMQVIGDEFTKKLADEGGMDITRLSSRISAQKFIQSQMLGLLGQVRGAQGEPPLKGGLEAMISTLPNPLDDPAAFHTAVNGFMAVLNHHIADADAALKYKQSAMDKGAQNQFLADRMRNAQAEAEEVMKHPELMGKEETAAPTTAEKPLVPEGENLKPLPRSTLERATVMIKNGDKTVKKFLKDKGYDVSKLPGD